MVLSSILVDPVGQGLSCTLARVILEHAVQPLLDLVFFPLPGASQPDIGGHLPALDHLLQFPQADAEQCGKISGTQQPGHVVLRMKCSCLHSGA